MIGKRFGRLTIISESGADYASRKRIKCRCDCGNLIVADAYNVKCGHTSSCGCLWRQVCARVRLRHGETVGGKMTSEYRIWSGMKQRCTNPNIKNFHLYGGAGVKVCDRWQKFEAFLQDMGRRPSAGHSIDRYPDTYGNYEPGNCRWATRTEQSRNRRRTSGWKKIGKSGGGK